MNRIYDYRCRSCGAEHAELAPLGTMPGPLYICACPRLVRYWRSRPETPFVPPDTTGMVFGPRADEIAETGRPHTRIRDDLQGMQLAEPERPMPEHVQAKLF